MSSSHDRARRYATISRPVLSMTDAKRRGRNGTGTFGAAGAIVLQGGISGSLGAFTPAIPALSGNSYRLSGTESFSRAAPVRAAHARSRSTGVTRSNPAVLPTIRERDFAHRCGGGGRILQGQPIGHQREGRQVVGDAEQYLSSARSAGDLVRQQPCRAPGAQARMMFCTRGRCWRHDCAR